MWGGISPHAPKVLSSSVRFGDKVNLILTDGDLGNVKPILDLEQYTAHHVVHYSKVRRIIRPLLTQPCFGCVPEPNLAHGGSCGCADQESLLDLPALTVKSLKDRQWDDRCPRQRHKMIALNIVLSSTLWQDILDEPCKPC